jgi:uncharacterized protein (TIGR02246 family)
MTDSQSSKSRPKVIILGAGFAGLNAVKKIKGRPCESLPVMSVAGEGTTRAAIRFDQASNAHPSHKFTSSPHRVSIKNRRFLMSKSFSLPTKPEDVVPMLTERLASGKVSALIEMFDPQCVFVEDDGRAVIGHAEISSRLERFVEPGIPLVTNMRHIFVGDDIAQLVYDWWIDGTARDGKEVHLTGTACDIVRRGADGVWRFIIDNNQGTKVR